MKLSSLVFVVLIVVIINSCSSPPDIKGLWQADDWDCGSIDFTKDLKYVKYENSNTDLDNEPLDNGDVSLSELEGRNCLILISNVFNDGSWAQNQAFSFEMPNENQMTLYGDKQKSDQCLDINSIEDLVKINMTKIK